MNNKLNNNFSLRKLLLTALVAGPLATLPAPLWALPDVTSANLTTSSGVTTQIVGSTLNVNSPDKAILTWQAFGSGASAIGATDVINYFLPSATSSVLNTVSGNAASVIAGSVISNGNVYVLNKSGIVISPTAQINTGGFYASTVDEPSGFFSINGSLSFAGTSTANVIVQGTGNTSGTDAATIQATGPGNNIYLAGNGVNVQGGKFFGNLFVRSSGTTTFPLTGATPVADPLATGVYTSFGSTGQVSINTVGATAAGGALNITTNGGGVSLAGGSTATATAAQAGGVVSLTLGAGGSTYGTTPPTVTIANAPTGGTNATATAILTGGVVTGFTVNGGSGYTSNPTVTLSFPQSLVISPNIAATSPAMVSINTTGSTVNGNISQIGTGQFNASQTGTVVTLNAGTGTSAGNITLGNTNMLTVGASGNNISITESSGLALGAVNAAGTLTVNLGNGSDLGSAGTVTAGGNIDINARAVSLTGSGNLTFSNLTSVQAVTISTPGDITLNQATAISSNRAISITSSGGKLTVTPALTSSTMTLAAPAGSISVTGLVTTGTTGANTNGAASITARGDIALGGGVTVRKNDGGSTSMTVTSSTGNITFGGAITSTTNVTATATAGSITAVGISSATLSLNASAGSVSTGNITTANGNLTVAAGSITVGNVSIGNNSINLTASTGSVSTGNIATGNVAQTLAAPSLSGSVTTGTIVQSNTSAAFNITSGGNVVIGNTISASNLNVTSTGGSITQTAAITSATRAVFNAAGDITLTNAANAFNAVALIGGASATTGFSVEDADNIVIGTGTNATAATKIKTNGNGTISLGSAASDSLAFGSTLTLTTLGTGIIETKANSVTVFGNVSLNTAGTSATLGQNIFGNAANYKFGQIQAAGVGALSVYENTTLNLGVIGAGSIDARSLSSDIINTGALTVTGNAIFAANSIFSPGSVSLTTATNNLSGSVFIGNAANFALVNAANTSVTAGTPLVNGKAGGGVTNVTVTGAGNTLTLKTDIAGVQTGGDFATVSFSAPGAVTITDPNTVTLQNISNTGTGAVTVTTGRNSVGGGAGVLAGGSIMLGSGIVLGSSGLTTLTSNGAAAAITDSAPAIRISGNVALVSDNSIAITNAGHSLGAVSLSTTGVNGAAGTANITYTEGGSANLNVVRINTSASTTVPAGSLTVVSTGGDVIQTATTGLINVPTTGTGTNTVSFSSSNGAVALLNPAATNAIAPVIAVSAVGNSTVAQAANIALGNVAVTGGTLTVDGSTGVNTTIGQAAGSTIKAFGNSTFNTQAGKITLTNSGNNFGGLTLTSNVAAAAGADVAITEAGPLNFVSVNTGTTGKLTATSEKASIIQSGTLPVVVGGATSLTAAAAGVALNTSTTNNFGGSTILVTTVGNVSIADSNATTVLNGASTIGGSLSLKNSSIGGTIKDSPGTLTVSGNVLFDTSTAGAMTGTVSIGSSTASLGAIQFRSGAVTIVENATLNLNAGSVASGAVSLTSSGNIVTSGSGGGTFQNKLDLNASGSITITNPIFVNGASSTGPGLTFRALGAVDLSSLSLAGNLNSIAPTNLGAASYKAPSP